VDSARACFSVEIYGPIEWSALSVLKVRYTVLAATCTHPEVNSVSVALEMMPLGGTPLGSGTRPQKFLEAEELACRRDAPRCVRVEESFRDRGIATEDDGGVLWIYGD
jgi:hypothetical protein